MTAPATLPGAGEPALSDPALRDRDPVVSVRGLSRGYGDVLAVDSISFEVQPGEMFGLIGPDGSGKTTILRILLGLLAPGDGSATVFGLSPWRHARRLSSRIGYLSQKFSLYGDLSVDENIAFFARIHGVRGWRPRRDELLRLLRLTPFRKRLAERLSGGMKQKLALACTLVHTPQLLILDEPTTGVDPVSRREFWKILTVLQKDGLTILLTTPYLDEAERCRRVGLMNRGRLLTVDTPDALKGSSKTVMIELIASPRRRAVDLLRARDDVGDVQIFGERLHVSLAGPGADDAPSAADRIRRELESSGLLVEMTRPMTPSLEDVFIARILEEGDPQRPDPGPHRPGRGETGGPSTSLSGGPVS